MSRWRRRDVGGGCNGSGNYVEEEGSEDEESACGGGGLVLTLDRQLASKSQVVTRLWYSTPHGPLPPGAQDSGVTYSRDPRASVTPDFCGPGGNRPHAVFIVPLDSVSRTNVQVTCEKPLPRVHFGQIQTGPTVRITVMGTESVGYRLCGVLVGLPSHPDQQTHTHPELHISSGGPSTSHGRV